MNHDNEKHLDDIVADLLEAAEIKLDQAIRLVRNHSETGSLFRRDLMREHSLRTERLGLQSSRIRVEILRKKDEGEETKKRLHKLDGVDRVLKQVQKTLGHAWDSASETRARALHMSLLILTVITAIAGMSPVISREGARWFSPAATVGGVVLLLVAAGVFGIDPGPLQRAVSWIQRLWSDHERLVEDARRSERQLLAIMDGPLMRIDYGLEAIADKVEPFRDGDKSLDILLRPSEKATQKFAECWKQCEEVLQKLAKERKDHMTDGSSNEQRALEIEILHDSMTDSMFLETPTHLKIPAVLFIVSTRRRSYYRDEKTAEESRQRDVVPAEVRRNIFDTLACLYCTDSDRDDDWEHLPDQVEKSLGEKVGEIWKDAEVAARSFAKAPRVDWATEDSEKALGCLSLKTLKAEVAGGSTGGEGTEEGQS